MEYKNLKYVTNELGTKFIVSANNDGSVSWIPCAEDNADYKNIKELEKEGKVIISE